MDLKYLVQPRVSRCPLAESLVAELEEESRPWLRGTPVQRSGPSTSTLATTRSEGTRWLGGSGRELRCPLAESLVAELDEESRPWLRCPPAQPRSGPSASFAAATTRDAAGPLQASERDVRRPLPESLAAELEDESRPRMRCVRAQQRSGAPAPAATISSDASGSMETALSTVAGPDLPAGLRSIRRRPTAGGRWAILGQWGVAPSQIASQG
jgi:hypothetical protein